jgi:hypothetical protein
MGVKVDFVFLGLVAALLALNACGKKASPEAEATQLRKAFVESNHFVTFAISAILTNDYPAAVFALENARTMPGIKAEQLMALQRAKEAITADLVSRAEAGDAKAQADLAALERSRSQ